MYYASKTEQGYTLTLRSQQRHQIREKAENFTTWPTQMQNTEGTEKCARGAAQCRR